ncbi:CDP-diacylglycerol diphosphatase [Enterobacter sp. WCHEn045836]|uniref:CDP-diacylglycerol diphosphatase n=1 Tax=Enterobacter sp. WCHEn045836 TaxID=2497434 RepID=UPI000F83B280|nr:CDP-diacylglycerol diphosphatase [Enterobacter sp. WCHEn045836]RTP93721.1 CDP-diacylglycerol diphosphatase [Enterobacter sp. WCHEn045836]
MDKLRRRKLVWIVCIVILVVFALYYIFGRGDTNALWKVVSEQCVPNQEQNNEPAPCLKVEINDRYVLFKDSKGPVHDLVMPTYKLSGIESAELQLDSAPPFFAYAWKERQHLDDEAGRPLPDSKISLAVNSKYGRSQDQLHIHLSCLKDNVSSLLEKEGEDISSEWKPIQQKIEGHEYIARKLNGTDLEKEDPFKLLNAYVESINDKIDKYGLAVSFLQDGTVVALATRFDLFSLNLGSAGEIQDYSCH